MVDPKCKSNEIILRGLRRICASGRHTLPHHQTNAVEFSGAASLRILRDAGFPSYPGLTGVGNRASWRRINSTALSIASRTRFPVRVTAGDPGSLSAGPGTFLRRDRSVSFGLRPSRRQDIIFALCSPRDFRSDTIFAYEILGACYVRGCVVPHLKRWMTPSSAPSVSSGLVAPLR